MKKLLLILLVVLVGCAERSFEDRISAPEGFSISKHNDAQQNELLKQSWSALDVAHVEMYPNGREDARILLTLSEYEKDIFFEWYNLYLDEKSIKIDGQNIAVECSFIPFLSRDVQACYYVSEEYSIAKYTFGIDEKIIVRVMCLEVDKETADKNCQAISTSVAN